MKLQLDALTSLLGKDVFFVPCIWGTKRPLVPYVERPFEDTKSADYLARFAGQPVNIAVYLGKASGGLCAIDFDHPEDLARFLAVNPQLVKTTQSRGSRGGMLWLRVKRSGSDGRESAGKCTSSQNSSDQANPTTSGQVADYPASCITKHFEWRADKLLSVIAGRHPVGMDYTLVCDSPPIELAFEEIVWPEGWELPWVTAQSDLEAADLVKTYGQPFYADEGRVTGINERYWAGLFAHENRVLYDPDEKSFYLYEEARGLWLTITSERIRETISNRILEVSRESREYSLEIQITTTRLKAVVSALMGIAEMRGAFRSKQPLIHAKNGVIRFAADGDVLFGGFSPEDFSRNQSPYSFDPAAECPRFLNELIYPAVSREDADLLQRWAGLALYGCNLPQRFLILDGTTNGGKGTLVRIVQSLVGIENTYQLRTECLTERFETYRYRGKTLLIGPDVPGDFLMRRGAAMLKVLVGGDPISAEGKGLNGDFPMFGTFNIVMTCNSRLRLRLDEDTGAWRRRLLVVRYERPPAARRLLYFDQILLREEGSGILRWAMTGFVKLQKEFLEIGDFGLTDSQRERVDSLLAESDSLRLFVQNRISRHDDSDITTAEFQHGYAEFCEAKGWKPLPLTIIERQAADVMLEAWQVPKCHCIERDGQNTNRGWKRVRLTPVTCNPERSLE